MADNFDFTPGVGGTGAADDVGGVLYPRVKINYGADGAATDVSDANPLPTKDAGTAFTSVLGVSGAAVQSADITTATAITDAPTAGQKIVLDDLWISTDTAMLITIEEETSGTVFVGFYLAADTAYQFTPRGKLKLITADKKLMADSDTAGNVVITAIYHSEA